MRNKHRNLLSVAHVLLCIALLAGTAVLLLADAAEKAARHRGYHPDRRGL